MTRGQRAPIVRAGRPPALKKVLAACNADAERMRRERAAREQASASAPVVVRPKAHGDSHG